jgi:ribose transport system permease protein
MAATDQVAAPSEFDPPDGHGLRRVRLAGASYARPMMGPIALVVIVAFFGALYPDTFLTRTNLVTNVLEVVAVLIIVASGQTVVMVVGEFDLSVGGVAALATAVTASFIATSTLDGQAQTPGSVFWSVVLGFVIGIGCGLLNGLLVAYLGVLAFIATLGMAQVYTSLANHRVDGQPVFGLVEHNFVDIARGDLLGVSNKIWISLAFAGAVWLLLDRTTLGRKMYAVGGNAHAAYLSGLNAKRIRLAAFATAGFAASVGGVLQAATTATANTSAPQPWMLQSIAGVFLGMAMFRSGRPNLPGTVLGVVLLRTLDNGLNFTDLNDYLQNAISGAAIVLAVLPPALARLRAVR